jgi:hypothetical protein
MKKPQQIKSRIGSQEPTHHCQLESMNHMKQNLLPPSGSLPGRIDVLGSLRCAVSPLIFFLLTVVAWTRATADHVAGELDLTFNPGSSVNGAGRHVLDGSGPQEQPTQHHTAEE